MITVEADEELSELVDSDEAVQLNELVATKEAVDELRKLIAVRNAKERSYILSKFDKLSDEERTVELIKKNFHKTKK